MADTAQLRAPGADPVRVLSDELCARYGGRITGDLRMPGRQGDYRPLPEGLEPGLKTALSGRGIDRLYSHQGEAWESVREGRDLLIVTPTASGKSLCYNLPVLQSVMQDGAKALYLFPTKALAQDQVAELSELNRAGDLGIRAFTFDGDTPSDARKAVRTRGDIVVSNPDMLHQAILPHHTKWAQFFEQLAFIVIDELHVYRGVFGSHMANVLRRLQRICRFYGVSPRYVCCSATIGNPDAFAGRMLGRAVHCINRSGAPRGERRLLLWNPPVVNADLGIRASARSQTLRIARKAMEKGLKSVVFAQSRLMVEVLTKYLKDAFDADPRRPARVGSYRGGYLPLERRATEKRLRQGDIDCVVSTSALELGVDIGSLDVCVLNGYPGTIAATWQRLGRAGRRNRLSLGVLVAGSLPLDQYIVRNPEFFLDASPEHASIDPDQLLILLDHVRCAAFELPFGTHDLAPGLPFADADLPGLLDYLVEENVVHEESGRWHWMDDSYPANSVSLRSVAEGNFVVIDVTAGAQTVIAEVDYSSAAETLYPGAIYMLQARPWQVEELDWSGRKAFVTSTRADYYTDAIDYTRLRILERFESEGMGKGGCSYGEVHVIRRFTGYKKIRYYTHENVGYGDIRLPDQEMHTTATWWEIRPGELEAAFDTRQDALDGFLGAAYAMHHVAALRLMTETSDIGRAVGDGDGEWVATVGPDGRGRMLDGEGRAREPAEGGRFRPAVFLYDKFPGGIGLAESLFGQRADVVHAAIALIETCSCHAGCPACVGPILAGDEERAVPARLSAVRVLRLLEERE